MATLKTAQEAHRPELLPLADERIDVALIFDALIDATSMMEVYKSKVNDSVLDQAWLLPTLQQKEALASSALEGTQATLDGILVDQVKPDNKNNDIIEIRNYALAAAFGYRYLSREKFNSDFILDIHKRLMSGSVRRSTNEIGIFRTQQNYVGKTKEHEITYTPPVYKDVPKLVDNLIAYISEPKDNLRYLVRTAIIHAQFETIHPFMDGNGRVGRILIPLYLYYSKQINMPCFFISEALERDKIKYYALLNNIRNKGQWSEWIRFFLETVTTQCKKYINIVTEINALYDKHLKEACTLVRNSQMISLIRLLYKYPIINAATVAKETDIPPASVNRYLSLLVNAGILYSNNKSRNRTYFYYDLLNIIRD